MIGLQGNHSSAKNDLIKLRKEINELYEQLDELEKKQWAIEDSKICFTDISKYNEYLEYCFPEIIDMEFKDKDYKPEKPKNVCAIFKRRAEWRKDENIPSFWLPFGKLQDGSLRKTKLGRLYLKLRSESSELFPTPKWFEDYDPYISPYWQSEEDNKEDEERAQKRENERVETLREKLYEANRNQNHTLANKIKKELEINNDGLLESIFGKGFGDY